MKVTYIFSAVAVAASLSLSSASAAVVFSGNTTGCFGSPCSSYAPTTTSDQYIFTGNSSFSGSTTSGPLNLSFASVTNPGFFDFTNSYAGQTFKLHVDFAAPSGARLLTRLIFRQHCLGHSLGSLAAKSKSILVPANTSLLQAVHSISRSPT